MMQTEVMIMYHYPRLREIRKDREFTQARIGKLLGIPQQQYYRYERGHQEIPAHHLITLADFYQTSVDFLLGRTDKE